MRADRRTVILISLAIVGLMFGSAILVHAQATEAPTTEPITFTPEIPIPGLLSGESTITGTSIVSYVRAIFILFIWTVGILATVMVIYGGIKWVAAAGNPGRINDARDIINNSIIGVIIALASIVLLNIINPNLTNFTGIDLGAIKKINFQTDTIVGENGEGTEGRACVTAVSGRPIRLEIDCVANVAMGWPVGGITNKKITSRVGSRELKVGSNCHPGTDFATENAAGKPVLAVIDGTISQVGLACGESSITLMGTNYHVRYVHVSAVAVAVGQQVKKGDTIGLSGGDPKSSPNVKVCSGGPHVHVEFYSNAGELHDITPCVQNFVERSIPGGQSQF